MKLLFDENLSRKLVTRLGDLFPGSLMWPKPGFWKASTPPFGIMIVSTDSDFFELATTLGPPPKVIWLRRWTCRTKDVEAVLRREAIRIAEFTSDPELGLLVLDKE